jgi:hypothetical protein
MTNRGMVVGCLTLLLVHSSGVSTSAAGQTPGSLDRSDLRLTIAVFAPPDMSERLVDRILAEAKAIWAPTGISLDWHRVTLKDVVRTWQLDVAIDDGPEGVATERAALGSILFTADGPESSIHLFRGTAEASILRTAGVGDTSVLTHEILVGRALGRALSHELGHYLLKSKEHSPRGLMRAAWRSEEFLAVERRGFELTPQQREIAAHFVQGPRPEKWRPDDVW